MEAVRLRRVRPEESEMTAEDELNGTVYLTSERRIKSRADLRRLVLLLLAAVIASVTLWYGISRSGLMSAKSKTKVRVEELRESTRYHRAIDTIAIGDVHGDYDALLKILRRVGIIDDNHDWSGGSVTLIQTGDQQDRGSQESDIYDLLFKLQDQAPRSGGRVYMLYGNHELMNSELDFRYVTSKGFTDLVGSPSDYVPRTIRNRISRLPASDQPRAWAVAPGGELSRRMADRMNVTIVIGDLAFVHGGLTPQNAKFIARLNEETRQLMLGERTELYSELSSGSGPVWLRTYSKGDIDSRGRECTQAEETLEVLGARAMVMGHTVQRGGINSRCNGQVWRIDTGMSAYYGGDPEALIFYSDGSRVIVTETDVIDEDSRSY